MRLNLAAVKASRVTDMLGLCEDDPRLLDFLNEGHRRLIHAGLYWNTFQTYQICVGSEGCLTWPRQVASIEALSVNDAPVTLRNGWFEYLQSGYGIRTNENSSELQLIDRGTACTFDDITDNSTVLEVYSLVAEDAGSQLLVQGYDENGNWIRSLVGSTYVDGEYIDISTTKTRSTNIFTAVTSITKPVTNGPVYLSKVDASSVVTLIGYYEADETLPNYRRSLIPGLADAPNYVCGDGDPLTDRRAVRAVVKLEHIDVVNDNDFFVIGNVSAIKNSAKAVQLEEQQNLQESIQHFQLALQLLDNELKHYEGTSNVEPLKIESDTWGAGQMPTVI